MTYTHQLLQIIHAAMERELAHPDAERRLAGKVPPVHANSTIEDLGKLARDFHTEICRKQGMTADQIIAEWNRRSPEDTW